jgi:TonB family protein
MRRRVAFIAALIISGTSLMVSQNTPQPVPERKITSRVAPNYPELAKKMRTQGIVKVEAVVRPNGSVKSTRVLGGNPVFIEAAADAVSKWKFEPSTSETTEVIQLTFIPQ